jgi:hypothetical protein
MAIENKPSKNEDEYFARENAELIKRLRAERDAQRAQAGTQAAAMTCPRCGGTLAEREYHNVKIDECTGCGGVWLDKGELQLLEHVDAPSRRSFISGLFGVKD